MLFDYMLISHTHRHSLFPFIITLVLPLVMQAAALFLPLQYERVAILNGQWWRLLSGGWLHHNLSHMMLNLIALSLLWLWGADLVIGWTLLLLLITLVTTVDLALFLFDPVTLHYWGLSAALHGLFAYMAIKALGKGEKVALLWIALLILKLWFDYHRVDQYTAQLIGTRVHTFSHLLGAVSGTLIGICCWFGNYFLRLSHASR